MFSLETCLFMSSGLRSTTVFICHVIFVVEEEVGMNKDLEIIDRELETDVY